jgi:hypothetical protein
LTGYKREPDTGAGSRTLRARKNRPFVGQPPNYVGPRRTDRPRRRDVIDRTQALVATEAMRSASPCPTEGELDAAFIAVMADDREEDCGS